MIAYTIGNPKVYDKNLVKYCKFYKSGKNHGYDDKSYEGGWVWKTIEEAKEFIRKETLSFPAEVYEINLPNGWEQDVSLFPGEDGVHNLLIDAQILRKVGD